MAYGSTYQDPKDVFRSWVRFQSELITVAVQEGYTEEQAIELIKLWKLSGIEDNTGLINGNY